MRLPEPSVVALLLALATSCSRGDSPPQEDPRSESDRSSDTAHSETECHEQAFPHPHLLGPRPGELFYQQIGLAGLTLGEAAIVVGPDGTRILIDSGNDRHVPTVLATLDQIHEASMAAGFPERPARELDHVVITHIHADHADGLDGLLDEIRVTGRVVHRGLVDLSDGVREANFAQFCQVLARNPDLEFTLCEGASAPCDGHIGDEAYPSTSCGGLLAGDLMLADDSGRSTLRLGEQARLDFLGVNGWMAGESYRAVVGPFQTDHNGENARSIVGAIWHGPFSLIFTGDLTGGERGHDDLEGFYAPRLEAAGDIDALGVDVVIAGHHGRRTSSSMVWMDRLAPGDGQSRNVIMGVSSAHIRSPHQEVLDNVFHHGRLGEGRAWTTNVAHLGRTAPDLINADGGQVVLSTLDGGRAYVVQAVTPEGALLDSQTYPSVRCR